MKNAKPNDVFYYLDRTFAVNDRRNVFHFMPKQNIWPKKYLALLRPNTKTIAETPFIPSSGGNAETIFAASLLSAISTLLVKSNSST